MKICSNNKVISIVLTGPESSGKTSLAKSLQNYFRFPMVSEFARTWLSEHGPIYDFEDLQDMMQKQMVLHDATLWTVSSKFVLADTDILNYIVWSEDKFEMVPPEWIDLWLQMEGRFYLLCSPDIPWEADPLREDPERRELIYNRHLQYLNIANKPFGLISGDFELRFKKAIDYIQKVVFKS